LYQSEHDSEHKKESQQSFRVRSNYVTYLCVWIILWRHVTL